jgi:hypothetical protein
MSNVHTPTVINSETSWTTPVHPPVGRVTMQYVVLIYESPKDFESRGSGRSHPYIAAWRAYYKALVAAGVYVGGAPLQDVGTATTVRLQDGRPRVQDGPFAEAKEQLGGFMILELPSLDAALEWAARCPAAAAGALEVRPLDVALYETVVAP